MLSSHLLAGLKNQSNLRNSSMVTGVAGDPAHGDSVYRIMARDRNFPFAVAHDDVFSLPENTKAGLLECPDRREMTDSRQLRHV